MAAQHKKQVAQMGVNNVSGLHREDAYLSAETVLAEMEIAPYDNSLMSLGIYKAKRQPKGFCVEYNAEIDDSDSVKAEVTARVITGGFQYLLQIVNNTGRTLCAEIRVF